jgi:hypothetical protein
MNIETRLKALRIALAAIGVLLIVGLYPLATLWPAGFAWTSGISEYLQMILGIYATLGVFLILAARDPLNNLSLIWFTVWSSLVHGGIMAVQALMNPHHAAHLIGDVPAAFLIAIILGLLTPRGRSLKAAAEAEAAA